MGLARIFKEIAREKILIPLVGILFGYVGYLGLQRDITGFSELKDIILAITPVAGLWLAAYNIRTGNELQSRARKREAAEAWLEKTYLSEGVEPIVNYLQIIITGIREDVIADVPEFPHSATTRMTMFFRHDRLFALLNILSDECHYYAQNKEARSSEGYIHLLDTFQTLNEQLLEFGTFLLYCEVNGKGDILRLNSAPAVASLSELIKNLFEEHFSKMVERSKLERLGVKEAIPEKPTSVKVGKYVMESPSRMGQKEDTAVNSPGDDTKKPRVVGESQ